MFAIAIVLFLASVASGSPLLGTRMSEISSLFDHRIVGGQPTDIRSIPYQVSLQIDGFHICGGSIIGPKNILTAAHCIIGMESEWDSYQVRIGSSLNNQGGQLLKVTKLQAHPAYNPANNWINDIAVLTLNQTIKFGSNALAVNLPRLNSPLPVGQWAIASGWGRLTEGGISPTQLQSVQIPINDPSVCEQAYGSGFKRNAMVCAASTVGGQSTCQGDSGGPLVNNGVQWGIVSWAAGCARPGKPTVFSHVANLRQFITNAVGI